MASRWDNLDASRELEQAIHSELLKGLDPRGYDVVHRGTATGHAPAGRPDIEARARDKSLLIHVEVTKRKGAAAEGEFISTIDHLDKAITSGGFGQYLILFSAPFVGSRLRKHFLEFNRNRQLKGLPGRAFMLDFAGLETILDELSTRDPTLYPGERWSHLLNEDVWAFATDDSQARQIAVEVLLEENLDLREELEEETRQEHARLEAELKNKIAKLEDNLRDRGITANNANQTLMYLTFMRLFEEKALADGRITVNRMTSAGFSSWVKDQNALTREQHKGRLINYLLSVVREEAPDLKMAGLLVNPDGSDVQLHTNVTDELVIDLVFKVMDEYEFIGSRLDILGVVFETLARRGEKDTRVGQFFTPEEVVNFCANVVELHPADIVLDPAVGTARFLIAAMQRMLDLKHLMPLAPEFAEASIKQNQLHGVDIDQWVATIAKMNMYIHGDGKSNVVAGNGLVLADAGVLPQWTSGVAGEIDVVLTNPPLGDVNFHFAAKDWAEQMEDPKADQNSFLEGLGVVPTYLLEQKTLDEKVALLDTLEREIAEIEGLETVGGHARKLAGLRKRAKNVQQSINELTAKIAAGDVLHRAHGTQLKGGALFLGAISNYLKEVSPARASEPFEWRGGRAVVIVDEAILNTAAYAKVREYIRRNFFVKAIISLGRPAFKYLAHTDAKTSILYVIKKKNTSIEQQEPVFYDHAEKVGFNARGAWIGSDLPEVEAAYEQFRVAVKSGYHGATFAAEQVRASVESLYGWGVSWHSRGIGAPSDRLDFYNARRVDLEQHLSDAGTPTCVLGDLIRPRTGASPEPSRAGRYEFAAIERNTATLRPKGSTPTKYSPSNLWKVKEGDIVISGIDLIHGAVAVARADVDGMVMSQEMFAYEVKDPTTLLPEYVALVLRTPQMKAMIAGITTGTSNRTRLSSAEDLMSIVVPEPPSLKLQAQIVARLNASHTERRDANENLGAAESAAKALWQWDIEAVEEDESDSGVESDSKDDS